MSRERSNHFGSSLKGGAPTHTLVPSITQTIVSEHYDADNSLKDHAPGNAAALQHGQVGQGETLETFTEHNVPSSNFIVAEVDVQAKKNASSARAVSQVDPTILGKIIDGIPSWHDASSTKSLLSHLPTTILSSSSHSTSIHSFTSTEATSDTDEIPNIPIQIQRAMSANVIDHDLAGIGAQFWLG